ncbi:MAG: alpha/beta hydrolase [Pseudomonadota bacterium]
MPITDWDDAYANAAYIPDGERIAASWLERAPAFRERHPPEVLPYGVSTRQVVDVFRSKQAAQGLLFFVHGGYWMAFSGRDFSHLAEGAMALGYAAALPSYTLAPDATIAEITEEVARGIAVAAAELDGPIILTGHSAGGHLVTRMMCEGVLPEEVAARVAHVVSISGVHDLRPLLNTRMREPLQLNDANVLHDSPALQRPRGGTKVTCVVGTEERPEFLRQTDLLANIWTGLGAETRAVHLDGENHFSIIDGLSRPDSGLTKLIVGHWSS